MTSTRPEVLLAAIHRHCLQCSGGSKREVHQCSIRDCNLWPWREPAKDTTRDAATDVESLLKLLESGRVVARVGREKTE